METTRNAMAGAIGGMLMMAAVTCAESDSRAVDRGSDTDSDTDSELRFADSDSGSDDVACDCPPLDAFHWVDVGGTPVTSGERLGLWDEGFFWEIYQDSGTPKAIAENFNGREWFTSEDCTGPPHVIPLTPGVAYKASGTYSGILATGTYFGIDRDDVVPDFVVGSTRRSGGSCGPERQTLPGAVPVSAIQVLTVPDWAFGTMAMAPIEVE